MSAKPQPMAGQPDTADDLIAELTKLMAEDAKSPPDASPPTFAVRIPGSDNASPATPVPRLNTGRTAASSAVPESLPKAGAPAATPSGMPPEPFQFDFDIGVTKSTPATPAQPAVADTPAHKAVERTAPAMAAVSSVDHDSIADLIAAEFSADTAPDSDAPAAPVPPAASSRSTAESASVQFPEGEREEQSKGPGVSNARPGPERDQFKVPPVFGLGTRASPVEPTVSPSADKSSVQIPSQPVSGYGHSAPAVTVTSAPNQDESLGSDPIDEIESLIGRAMRVDLEHPTRQTPAERPAASPALRSLATPVAPAVSPAVAQPVSDPSAAQPTLSSVDETIIAAALATGAEIGWVEPADMEEARTPPPVARQRRRRTFRMSRSLAGPLVAVTLLLAAGFGLYWMLGLSSEAGPAPLLTADASPIKETPAVQPDAAVAPQSVVFNEIDGVVPGAEEQLVSRDQTEVSEVTQVPSSTDLSEEGLANRKVRTVTVRPDGTIVSGEESVAGNTILPVARPNVPEVPGAEAASSELLANVEPEDVATTSTEPVPDATNTDLAATEAPAVAVTPVTPGSIVPAVDATGNPISGKTAPVPLLRPTGLAQTRAASLAPASPVNAVVDTPTAAGNLLPPPPVASSEAAIPGAVEVDALPNSAPAYAQLASLRSEAEARQAAQALVTRFGPVFGGANMEVQRVDLGARGVYYRVRVPAASTEAAGNICTNVIAAGGDCVLM